MARLNNRNARKAARKAAKAAQPLVVVNPTEAEIAALEAQAKAEIAEGLVPDHAARMEAEEIASLAEEAAEIAANAEIDEQIAKSNSVVKRKYKLRYKERAREAGLRGKAAKRSNWDWLAQQLAAATLTKKEHLDVGAFLAILEENGIDHTRWPNRSKGWEGRLRMTGRLALQTKVAETGVLLVNGEQLAAPADWVAHHTN